MEIQKESPKHRTDENISVRSKIRMGRSEEIDNNLISWSIMQLVFWNKSRWTSNPLVSCYSFFV